MISAGIYLLISNSIYSITDVLGGNHWCKCPKARLHSVEAGLIKLAKIPLPKLSKMINIYLSQRDVDFMAPHSSSEEIYDIRLLRNLDIAALTRIVYRDVPRYSRGKWFGPLIEDDMWKYENNHLALKELPVLLVSGATFDAKAEFLFYKGKLPLRFRPHIIRRVTL